MLLYVDTHAVLDRNISVEHNEKSEFLAGVIMTSAQYSAEAYRSTTIVMTRLRYIE